MSLIFLLLFSSCEKNIHLKVQEQPAKLVVDASIENNKFPVVVLSTSLNYFSSITAEELAKSFVRGQPYANRIALTLYRDQVHNILKKIHTHHEHH